LTKTIPWATLFLDGSPLEIGVSVQKGTEKHLQGEGKWTLYCLRNSRLIGKGFCGF
jgi:hypothetical protein